jgi:23S rRNA (guanosine2251-2'-O)-methyltransferase
MSVNKNENYEYIYGINPVYSLIIANAGRRKIYRVIINTGRKRDPKIQRIIKEAGKKGIGVEELKSPRFNDIVCEDAAGCQGICARVSPYNYWDLDNYLDRSFDKRFKNSGRLIALDGVTDVGNFGSIIRNCYAFGFNGIIIPAKRSVSLNKRVSKISAGALEEVKVFRVVNIVRTIRELKKRGFWIYGTTLDTGPGVSYLDEVNFIFPMVLVMGSEDVGISRLVRDNCDFMISIRLSGRMQSLNVSVSSGIILYEVQEKIEKQDRKE